MSTRTCPYAEATAVGREAIRAKLEIGLGTLERLPTTIHELLESGDTIMVERTEVWHHPTGERATLRVAAVFKFRDGLITLWRDYWDAPTLFSPAAGELAARHPALRTKHRGESRCVI